MPLLYAFPKSSGLGTTKDICKRAEIAWQHLSAASRARAATLLKLNPQYSSWIANVPTAKQAQTAFLMAATWPDFIKRQAGYIDDTDVAPPGAASSQNIGYSDKLMHKYWHFIDMPFSSDGTALIQPVAPNVKTQTELFTAAIASTGASDDIESYDLVWLEHLVGDIHQPLHATSRFSAAAPIGDQGGNLVVLCGKPCQSQSELHAFWDDVLGTSHSSATAITAADNLPAAPAAAAAITDDQVWINESFSAAKKYAFALPVGPGDGPYTLTARTRPKPRPRQSRGLNWQPYVSPTSSTRI